MVDRKGCSLRSIDCNFQWKCMLQMRLETKFHFVFKICNDRVYGGLRFLILLLLCVKYMNYFTSQLLLYIVGFIGFYLFLFWLITFLYSLLHFFLKLFYLAENLACKRSHRVHKFFYLLLIFIWKMFFTSLQFVTLLPYNYGLFCFLLLFEFDLALLKFKFARFAAYLL